MKFNVHPNHEWKISQEAERAHNVKYLEDTLGFFNRIMHSCVYMVDYYKQKLIVGTTSVPTITGYPRDLIKKEGFKIYNRVCTEHERETLQKMDAEAHKLFDRYDNFEDRLGIELSYDIVAKNKTGREFTLYHRLVPFKLCDNGNMWLALCLISTNSLVQKTTRACIQNHITGETFDFIDGKFVLSKQKCLTDDEVAILGYLADGVLLKQISKKMGISLRTVSQKEKSAFDKLGVCTQASAVYKAKDMGLI